MLDDLQKQVAKALEDKYVITADKASDMAENWLEYASAATWTQTVEQIAANIAKQEELQVIESLIDVSAEEITVEQDYNEMEPPQEDYVIDDAQTYEENQLSLDLWEEHTQESTTATETDSTDYSDSEEEEPEEDDSDEEE